MTDFNRCPFCKCSDVELVRADVYYVECLWCKAHGCDEEEIL